MPRANPPPRATPIAGARLAPEVSEMFDRRESSRPKACTERMTFPRCFIGTPRSLFAEPFLLGRFAGFANPTSICVRCHECVSSYIPRRCYLGLQTSLQLVTQVMQPHCRSGSPDGK